MRIIEYPAIDFALNVSEFIFQEWKELSNKKDKVFIGLSGGSTPIPILTLLSEKELPWEKFYFFIVDERIVEASSEQSNFGNIFRAFFSKVPCHYYPMLSNLDGLEDEATKYSMLLKKELPLNNGNIPVFDQILLGMGDDGHVASLFGNSKAIAEAKRIVVSNFIEKFNSHRLTFTFPLLNSSRSNVLIFKGLEKRHIFDKLSSEYPVSKLKTDFVLHS